MKNFLTSLLSDDPAVSSKRFAGVLLIVAGVLLGIGIIIFLPKYLKDGLEVVKTFLAWGAGLLGLGKIIDKLPPMGGKGGE